MEKIERLLLEVRDEVARTETEVKHKLDEYMFTVRGIETMLLMLIRAKVAESRQDSEEEESKEEEKREVQVRKVTRTEEDISDITCPRKRKRIVNSRGRR